MIRLFTGCMRTRKGMFVGMAFSFHTDFSQRFLVQCIINTSAKMKDKTNKRDPKICEKKLT